MPTKPSDLPKNFTFEPLEEFEYLPFGTYYPGNTYNCTQRPAHTSLRKLCAKWLDEGKIEITPVKGFVVTQVAVQTPTAEAT